MSMSDSETPRRSQRRHKGIPANKFADMQTSQQKPFTPQGITDDQVTPRHPQFTVSAQPQQSQNAQPQQSQNAQPQQSQNAQPQQRQNAQPQQSQTSQSQNQRKPNVQPQQSQPHLTSQQQNLADLTREFDKKITEMRNEFQRQMHAMQELMRASTEQVTNRVLELRDERRSESVGATQHPLEYARETTPAISEIGSRPVEQRQKKIYPLPTFTGKPEEWQSFIDSFNSTSNEFDYSNLHNIMRLRDAIQGKARETVEALLSNSANVSAILDTLKQTYGRPEQLMRSQIEKVRQLATIAEDNLEQLVDLANKVTNMSTFLKNANGEHHLSNPILLSEMVGKLPTSRQLQWAEKCLSLERPATVVDFSDWLNNIRRIANMVSDSLPTSSRKRPVMSTAHASTLSSKPNSRNFVHVAVVERKCILCSSDCKGLETCNTFKAFSLEQRWQKVKEMKICFACLKKGHRSNHCFKKTKCGVNGCNRNHHSLLHDPNINSYSSGTRHQNSTAVENVSTDDHVSCHYTDVAASESVLFQVIPIKLHGNGIVISTYAFIDDGANASIVDSQIVHQLGISGRKSTLELFWLNREMVSEATEIIDLVISGVRDDAKKYRISNVHTSSKLALPPQSFDVNKYSEKNLYLSGLPLNSYENVQPKIILSLTHAYLTVPIEAPRTGSGPIAVKTRLGWLAYGPINFAASKPSHWICHTYSKQNDKINDLISSYFAMESFGVKINVKPPVSEDDARAVSILEKTTRKLENRYEVGLLWRRFCPPFPDSFDTARKRLEAVERKMNRDPEFAEQYREKIAHYIKKGYAERLSEEDAKVRTSKTFYVPHFGVKNPNKKGIRLVFDAAAEVKNISLNKLLLPGPDINQPLLAILFKFRQAPVAIIGDIQEMFHQICVRKEDWESQRFIWRDGKPENPIETYVMKRLIFGATCSPAVAQYVKNLNAKTFASVYPRAVIGICERHYVDDYVDCFQSEEEAIKVIREVIEIHKAAGFNLRNINSNSKKIKLVCGDQEEDAAVKIEKDLDRILGMHWLTSSDTFVFKLKFNGIPQDILEFRRKPTKRELLRLHMSIFDPYGFLVNFMITAKIIMQAVWKTRIQWDEKISDELYSRWKSWMQELPNVLKLRISRCYAVEFEKSTVDLHIFVDASEQALAVVAYWRVIKGDRISVVFVAAKSSCAPIRFHTIPKLELQAAAMGVRLERSILAHHDIKSRRSIFWSDSSTVLRWIRSDHKRYKQYVANRVSEILESSKVGQWRWCPGEMNPADDATRAKFPPQYNEESRWKLGPEFLLKKEEYWPREAFGPLVDDEEELRTKFIFVTKKQVCSQIPDINRFSNYLRLKRSTAWMLRYVANLKRKIKGIDLLRGPLNADEERAAEVYLCRWLQGRVYEDEISDITKKGAVAASSTLKMLNPFVGSDGLIRCNSRLQRAECISPSAKRPIILPNKHALTRLMVQHYHNKFRHINIATIMSEIRQRFWIPSLRRLVNSAQSTCMICKIRKAKPIQPQMSELPVDRVQPFVRPFTYTGVDMFGPLTVTIRRCREKRWVCLFTCLTVRAVHLEVATDLSSDAFILCLRNFMNRRGVPRQIRSDNGTNFVGVPAELRDTVFIDHDSITEKLSPLGIRWIFNTPSNPAQGGIWERLVQSIKKVLYNMLVEEAPRLDTLTSLLIEAECIVNSRPLTHLPVTPDEPEPLTPNHFLLGGTNSTHTPSSPEPRFICLRKQWRVLNGLKNCFWKRWIAEYLPELTRRTKWCLPAQTLNTGCIVLICDSDAPRSKWRRGRVVALYYGKDGIARSAAIDTTTGIMKRPVSKLALLDIQISPGKILGESPPESIHGGGSVGDRIE